ncbi:MAG TPA: hypothetical protein VM557_03705 [Thermoanaerobaculia bacterium]|nr:hypothetical protein [Thermoanaerobaculia bacterium]
MVVGLRIDLLRDWQVTLEHSIHDVKIAREMDIDETLITLRYRRTWTGRF